MQLWLSGSCSCALLCRVRLRLWLWPVYCPLDFIAHFRVLVVAGMWIWLWRIRSVLLIQAKKKTRPECRVSPFTYSSLPLQFRVSVITTYLQFYHVSNSLFRCTYIHTNAGNTPADPLAGILLLPIATLLSFYIKQIQHFNLHLSLNFILMNGIPTSYVFRKMDGASSLYLDVLLESCEFSPAANIPRQSFFSF